MEGWIKLHRQLLTKPIWLESTPEQKTILITLLMMANHEGREWEWKGKLYKADPGQIVTSLPSIVEKCGKGITIQNVRTALKRFEKYGFLTDESTNKNRLITIVNWGIYQSSDNQTNSQTNRQLTGNQQAANRQLTANKNDKNYKNDKNERNNTFEAYTSNPELIETLESFLEFRKKIKKPMTDRAVTLLLNKLDSLASDDNERIEILNQSILNGWQSIYELKKGGASHGIFSGRNEAAAGADQSLPNITGGRIGRLNKRKTI